MTANKFALHRTNPGLKTLGLRSLRSFYQLFSIPDLFTSVNYLLAALFIALDLKK